MRALAFIMAGAAIIVLAFASYRHGEMWGAFTYASLLFLLVFGPTLRRQPAQARAARPLDEWLPPEQER